MEIIGLPHSFALDCSTILDSNPFAIYLPKATILAIAVYRLNIDPDALRSGRVLNGHNK
jgi:cation transporter-like permease